MNFNMNLKRMDYPKNITVTIPRDIKKITVTWDKIINPDETISTSSIYIKKIGYNIYRSESMNGIYYKINDDVIFTNRYDDDLKGLNFNTTYWYKVSTICIFSNNDYSESKLSTPIRYEVKNDNKWFTKINERNMWILKNTGILMDLYIRKTDGEKCTKCYDDIRGQAADSRCPMCFGTGIVGGYEPATQLYIRQKPASQQIDLSGRGYALNSNPGAWTISSIHIHNRDLLINPEGRILSVTNSSITHAAGYYFHQELQTKEIDPFDIKYTIPRVNLYPEF